MFRTICSGNYCLPEDKLGKFVHREQPLQQLVRILKCKDGTKSFFVVTGEWHQNRRFLVLCMPMARTQT